MDRNHDEKKISEDLSSRALTPYTYLVCPSEFIPLHTSRLQLSFYTPTRHLLQSFYLSISLVNIRHSAFNRYTERVETILAGPSEHLLNIPIKTDRVLGSTAFPHGVLALVLFRSTHTRRKMANCPGCIS